MKRSFCLGILLLMVLALAACNGTISSIGVPASSPWTSFSTFLTSPYDDLTVITTGSNITAELAASGSLALCDSDQGRFMTTCAGVADAVCNLTNCEADAPEGATNVSFLEQRFLYGLSMTLDRPAFTAGGVELESATAGTLGAIGLTVSSASGLSIGAGFTEGLIPTPSGDPNPSNFDDGGALLMTPGWADFGLGWVCADGTSTGCDLEVSLENVVAGCAQQGEADVFQFRVDAAPGTYSMTCGSVPVTFTLTGPNVYESAGDCIAALKAERCAGLKGQDRAACNHAQIGICHATFNVPSAHAD
ncbi:MAG TPA: hypothetical protein VF789_11045 [Thermoanaerobaculia bacterium]